MGVVISDDLAAGTAQADQPLTHARIGYQKITGTITASGSANGFPASAADNELTYSFWKPDAMPGTWEIDIGGAETVNYFGIAAHTCGTDQAEIHAEYWNGSSWIEIDSVLPGDDSPIMFIFDDVFAAKYRVRLTGSTAPRIGVIYIGELLEMQRGIYGGHSPLSLSRNTVVRPTLSERGQFLGRSIIRSGSSTTWQWRNLTAAWYRANFDPFVEHARTKPFFIAWRPATYPNEVGYCWTRNDIQPSNTGTRDLMEVSMTAEGLGID